MFSIRRPVFALTLAALAIAVSACGGGGGGSPLPLNRVAQPQPTQTVQPAQKTGPANLTILIPPPNRTNKHFRPGYISAGTQSVTVGLVSGTTISNLATANLTQGSSNCTVPSGGGLQCTVTVQAPFGTDVFSISTYSGQNASGSLLSTGEVSATLTLGGTTPTVALSLNGVPATVSLVLGQSELPVGNPGSTAVIVQAWDASGNLIIGPGIFATSLSLAIGGDTYKTLSINYGPGQSSITSPGQVATLTYNGGTNVGSTLTVSGSGVVQATPLPTFNATGAVLNLFQYYDTADSMGFTPYGVAALPNGTAAVWMTYGEGLPDAIGIASPTTGMQYVVTGNTVDPYNPGTGSASYKGITVISNMGETLLWYEGSQYNELAALPNGNVAYGTEFNDNPQSTPSGICYNNGDLDSGTIGIFNPTAQTTTEYILHGLPAYIQSDSNNNVWFVEYSGMCNGAYMYPDEWAIGEVTNAGVVTETDFAAAGITAPHIASSPYPSAMSISPDGSTMYIADSNNGAIIKVELGATPTFQAVANPSINTIPDEGGMATAPDQTTAWFSDTYDPHDNYYYGYFPGSGTFSSAILAQGSFPSNEYYAYGMAYADGSFWIGGNEYDEEGLIGRISNVAAGAPIASNYLLPAISDYEGEYQYLYSVSAGGGYVWATDEYYGYVDSMQYGAPSTGVMTYTRVRQLTNYPRLPHSQPRLPRLRPNHKRRTSRRP